MERHIINGSGVRDETWGGIHPDAPPIAYSVDPVLPFSTHAFGHGVITTVRIFPAHTSPTFSPLAASSPLPSSAPATQPNPAPAAPFPPNPPQPTSQKLAKPEPVSTSAPVPPVRQLRLSKVPIAVSTAKPTAVPTAKPTTDAKPTADPGPLRPVVADSATPAPEDAPPPAPQSTPTQPAPQSTPSQPAPQSTPSQPAPQSTPPQPVQPPSEASDTSSPKRATQPKVKKTGSSTTDLARKMQHEALQNIISRHTSKRDGVVSQLPVDQLATLSPKKAKKVVSPNPESQKSVATAQPSITKATTPDVSKVSAPAASNTLKELPHTRQVSADVSPAQPALPEAAATEAPIKKPVHTVEKPTSIKAEKVSVALGKECNPNSATPKTINEAVAKISSSGTPKSVGPDLSVPSVVQAPPHNDVQTANGAVPQTDVPQPWGGNGTVSSDDMDIDEPAVTPPAAAVAQNEGAQADESSYPKPSNSFERLILEASTQNARKSNTKVGDLSQKPDSQSPPKRTQTQEVASDQTLNQPAASNQPEKPRPASIVVANGEHEQPSPPPAVPQATPNAVPLNHAAASSTPLQPKPKQTAPQRPNIVVFRHLVKTVANYNLKHSFRGRQFVEDRQTYLKEIMQKLSERAKAEPQSEITFDSPQPHHHTSKPQQKTPIQRPGSQSMPKPKKQSISRNTGIDLNTAGGKSQSKGISLDRERTRRGPKAESIHQSTQPETRTARNESAAAEGTTSNADDTEIRREKPTSVESPSHDEDLQTFKQLGSKTVFWAKELENNNMSCSDVIAELTKFTSIRERRRQLFDDVDDPEMLKFFTETDKCKSLTELVHRRTTVELLTLTTTPSSKRGASAQKVIQQAKLVKKIMVCINAVYQEVLHRCGAYQEVGDAHIEVLKLFRKEILKLLEVSSARAAGPSTKQTMVTRFKKFVHKFKQSDLVKKIPPLTKEVQHYFEKFSVINETASLLSEAATSILELERKKPSKSTSGKTNETPSTRASGHAVSKNLRTNKAQRASASGSLSSHRLEQGAAAKVGIDLSASNSLKRRHPTAELDDIDISIPRKDIDSSAGPSKRRAVEQQQSGRAGALDSSDMARGGNFPRSTAGPSNRSPAEFSTSRASAGPTMETRFPSLRGLTPVGTTPGQREGDAVVGKSKGDGEELSKRSKEITSRNQLPRIPKIGGRQDDLLTKEIPRSRDATRRTASPSSRTYERSPSNLSHEQPGWNDSQYSAHNSRKNVRDTYRGDRERDKGLQQGRDLRDLEREKEREREDREREREREDRERERERERDREMERARNRDRSWDRDRDRYRDRDREGNGDRDRDRRRDTERGRDKDRDGERSRDKSRKADLDRRRNDRDVDSREESREFRSGGLRGHTEEPRYRSPNDSPRETVREREDRLRGERREGVRHETDAQEKIGSSRNFKDTRRAPTPEGGRGPRDSAEIRDPRLTRDGRGVRDSEPSGRRNNSSRDDPSGEPSGKLRSSTANPFDSTAASSYKGRSDNHAPKKSDSPRNGSSEINAERRGSDRNPTSEPLRSAISSDIHPNGSRAKSLDHSRHGTPRLSPSDPHRSAGSSPAPSPRGQNPAPIRPSATPATQKHGTETGLTTSAGRDNAASPDVGMPNKPKKAAKKIYRQPTKENPLFNTKRSTGRKVNFISGIVQGASAQPRDYDEISVTFGHGRDILDDRGWVQKEALDERVPKISRATLGIIHGLITRAVENLKREMDSSPPITSDRMRIPYAPHSSRHWARELKVPIPEGRPNNTGVTGVLRGLRSVQVTQQPSQQQQQQQFAMHRMQQQHLQQQQLSQQQIQQQQQILYHHPPSPHPQGHNSPHHNHHSQHR